MKRYLIVDGEGEDQILAETDTLEAAQELASSEGFWADQDILGDMIQIYRVHQVVRSTKKVEIVFEDIP